MLPGIDEVYTKWLALKAATFTNYNSPFSEYAPAARMGENVREIIPTAGSYSRPRFTCIYIYSYYLLRLLYNALQLISATWSPVRVNPLTFPLADTRTRRAELRHAR